MEEERPRIPESTEEKIPGAAGAGVAASGAPDGICGACCCGATGSCVVAGSCWGVTGVVVEGFNFKDSSSETWVLA